RGLRPVSAGLGAGANDGQPGPGRMEAGTAGPGDAGGLLALLRRVVRGPADHAVRHRAPRAGAVAQPHAALGVLAVERLLRADGDDAVGDVGPGAASAGRADRAALHARR